MGRFSFQEDQNVPENDCADPMDWTMISDDEHENNITTTNTDDDDVMMLARMKLNDDTNGHESDEMDRTGNSYASTSRDVIMAAYNNESSSGDGNIHTSSASGRMESYEDDAHHVTHANSNSTLLQMTPHCLQQLLLLSQMQLSSHEQQQLHHRRKRNKTIILLTILVAVVLTAILKWHAPPPPPLTLLNKRYYLFDANALSAEVDDSSSISISNNVDTNDLTTTTHHETWGEYTSEVVQLTTAAIAYSKTVIWYVVSNSFKYAALDVRDWIVGVVGYAWKQSGQFPSPSVFRDDDDDDGHNKNVIQSSREMAACPIRIQAACNYHTMLPQGVAARYRIVEGFSTEESIRQQPLMLSLPSQNIALQLIAQGIDSWGENMMEETESKEFVHRMASFILGTSGGATTTAAASSTHSPAPVQRDYKETDKDDFASEKESITMEWILPPAAGFLFVGPSGVGKQTVAQHLADWFFAHCSTNCRSDDTEDGNDARNPVLKITAGDKVSVENVGDASRRRSIAKHIERRQGLGSVIIIHHIEQLHDDGLLSDIIKVLNGETNTLRYADDGDDDDDGRMESAVSCDGTVFLLTTEQWGTKRLFQMIQRNGGLSNLPWKGMLSGIRWEVDSYLLHGQRLNSRTTIVPFLPFQQDDLLLIMQQWFRELSDKHKYVRWARLDVSPSLLNYSVGEDQVDYLDLYHDGNFHPTRMSDGDKTQQSSNPLLTFSTNGAHALYDNSFYTSLKSKLNSGTRRRPNKVALLHLDEDACIFCWCELEYTDVNECETQWRLSLTLT